MNEGHGLQFPEFGGDYLRRLRWQLRALRDDLLDGFHPLHLALEAAGDKDGLLLAVHAVLLEPEGQGECPRGRGVGQEALLDHRQKDEGTVGGVEEEGLERLSRGSVGVSVVEAESVVGENQPAL